MKRFLLAAGLVFFIIVFTRCSFVDQTKEPNAPRIFGATYMTRNNPYFDVLNDAIEQVVESNGDILITRDPCQDQEKQNDQILEMIDEGIEVLFLNPVDWESVRPALIACKEAGVVVINVDTVVRDTEYVTSIIETDNYQAGVLCAQDMMERVDEAQIIMIDCPWIPLTETTTTALSIRESATGNLRFRPKSCGKYCGRGYPSMWCLAETIRRPWGRLPRCSSTGGRKGC